VTEGAIFRWPEGVRAAAAVTFDVDAESAILADAPEAAARMSVMTHQAYGPRTGVPRLLRLLERQRLRATFFVPGHTADRFPDAVRAIRDAGHEIGHHGYCHEPAHRATADQEETHLLRGLDALDRIVGVRPTGYRAPWWETTYRTPALLARHGFRYDSSLMDADRPYMLDAVGADGAPAAVHPYPAIVEIPIQWGLDDWEQYGFLPGLTGSGVIESPAKVEEMWSLELAAQVAEGGCFVLTMHPFLSGRASRVAALERLLERMRSIPGLWIATLDEIAEHVAALGLPPVRHTQPPLDARPPDVRAREGHPDEDPAWT
jgi:peptidoglycan/xylan/chitin deacetylase (PgdA/CDA1 family)